MAEQHFTPEELKTEQWRDIPGYEGSYRVSNIGRVCSLDRLVPYSDGRQRVHKGMILSTGITPQGYYWVDLGKKNARTIHSLVMLAFSGPCPEGKEINHKDGNPGNNRIENLEYVTHSENLLHQIYVLGGTRVSCKGGDSHFAKFTEQQVREIRAEREALGTHYHVIAERYGVHWKTISKMVRRISWSNLD